MLVNLETTSNVHCIHTVSPQCVELFFFPFNFFAFLLSNAMYVSASKPKIPQTRSKTEFLDIRPKKEQSIQALFPSPAMLSFVPSHQSSMITLTRREPLFDFVEEEEEEKGGKQKKVFFRAEQS